MKIAKTKATSRWPPKSHARGHQLHGEVWARTGLPGDDRRAARLLAPRPDVGGEHVAFGTAFYESIDARDGVTTGISAYDRARTIQVAIDPCTRPADLARPGHVFPLRARKGGVLVRAGQTEASVDLARLAGLVPAGVICEIMNDDGTMARVPDSSISAASTT